MVTLLFQYGGVIFPNERYGRLEVIEYYASSIKADSEATAVCLDEILEHGINWDETNVLTNGTERVFNGTFATHELYVRYLYGELVLSNGKRYHWATMVDHEETDFGSFMQLLTQASEVETALDKLKQRLYSTDDSMFSYDCRIR